MQYRDIPTLKKATFRATIGKWIKALIFLCISVFIYFKIVEHPLKFDQVDEILGVLTGLSSLYLLLSLIILTFINWGLESLKWKLLVSKIEKVSYLTSVRSVLSGLSFGFITPHAIGDYAGRIWQLNVSNRFESVGAVMLGRAAQYFATFTFGLFGSSYLFYYQHGDSSFLIFASVAVFITLIAGISTFIYLRKKFLTILSYRKLNRLRRYFKVILTYSNNEILQLLLLAFARYFIFALQFYLLLVFFRVSSDELLIIAGVTWTLFAKSTIPSFNFLSDLGVREISALFFFSYYGVDNTMVLLASFTLWCLNILIPAILGTVGILNMKIFPKK